MSLYGNNTKVCVYLKWEEMDAHPHARWYGAELRRAGISRHTPITRFEMRLGKGVLKKLSSKEGFELDRLTLEKISEMWAYMTRQYVQAVTPESAGKRLRDRKVTDLWKQVQQSRYVPHEVSVKAGDHAALGVSNRENPQQDESAIVVDSVSAADADARRVGAVPAFVQRSVFSSCLIDAKIDTSSPAIGAALAALARHHRGPHGFLPQSEAVLPTFRSNAVTTIDVAEVAPMRGSERVRLTLRVQGELPAWTRGPHHPRMVSAG